MSITPQFLDQLRERVPLSEVVGRFVTWDQKKSRPAQGDFWAPCPFHSEKTASFHADDRKGFYYCFGCHAKGDSIGFLREKGNMEFVEAVRELAGMAGVDMPAYDGRAKEKADAHARLIAIHENASRYFALQLYTSAGAQARNYLENTRRLSSKTIKEFGLGYSPNGRDVLLNHLRNAGFNDQEILDAGLALKPDEAAPDDHSRNFDRFRHRIMFPIHDARGRIVAFGGRALDENARAKYLNSAESEIFHKGRVVYNFLRARESLNKGEHFLLVEGYMDVIALHQAGFKSAVAPMGTAVTLEQMELLWRVDPSPILALDGDQAGQRAATRAANLVLPKLSASKSLRFVKMPEGMDPDDVLNTQGTGEMRRILHHAEPMVERLWQIALQETDAVGGLETPEARSAFDARLRAMANSIADKSLQAHYLADFRERRQTLYQRAKPAQKGNSNPQYSHASPGTRSNIEPFRPQQMNDMRLALILRTVLNYPHHAKRLSEDLVDLECKNRELERLRKDVILAYGDEETIENLATEKNLKLLEFGNLLPHLSFFQDDAVGDKALSVSTDDLRRAHAQKQAREEVEHILRELQSGALTEEQEAMVKNAVIMRDEARKILDERMDDDEDKKAFLRQFLESERWRK